MAYDNNLVIRVREYLSQKKEFQIEEKKMFGGLAFMVNGKMCINVGAQQLMCRFDPKMLAPLSKRKGFLPMLMNGKEYKGYCYVDTTGYESEQDFEFWVNLCLNYNEKAVSKKKTKAKK